MLELELRAGEDTKVEIREVLPYNKQQVFGERPFLLCVQILSCMWYTCTTVRHHVRQLQPCVYTWQLRPLRQPKRAASKAQKG